MSLLIPSWILWTLGGIAVVVILFFAFIGIWFFIAFSGGILK